MEGTARIAARPLELRYGPHGAGCICIELCGALDQGSAGSLALALAEIERSPFDELVLELSRLTFVDAAGALVLLDVVKRMKRRRRGIKLRGASPQVQRLLSLSGVDRLLDRAL